MEEERSYIIEQVIPAFKEKTDEHGVDVSVIDLRWGITEEESRSGKVLEICLRHIDNCRPLFIGIVGDRYGWCPSPEDFTDNEDLKSNFPEIEDYFNEGMSITEIEMQYGAINSKKETDAIFFLRNKPHGKGKSHERNGNTYEGYWMHGKKHGYGIYESSGKYIYEGDYQYDLRHGKGTLIYLDDAEGHYMGDRYEGDFKNNEFEGYGKYRFADGDIYEGEFHKSSLEGYGVLTFGDGYRYEGQFKNYLFHGRGVLYYNDGRWFEGVFENDEMNGEGVLHLPNDAVITGTWKDGERVGLFTLTLPNGETHQRMY